MTIPAQHLLEYWKSVQLDLHPPATQEAITDFQSRYSIQLPKDFSDLLLATNGTTEDNEGLRFWDLDEIKPISEVLNLSSTDFPKSLSDPQNYFIFADWLIHAHFYAIRLKPELSQDVLWVGYGDHFECARSFSEFIQLYLAYPGERGFLFEPNLKLQNTAEQDTAANP
jgi:hypothetical protein